MRVLADELADLVHEEDDAVLGATRIEILLDPSGEVLGREVECRLRVYRANGRTPVPTGPAPAPERP